jgi:hypothetical protein
VSTTPKLDSLGELYDGFRRDRRILKKRLPRADYIWRKAFEEVQRTEEFYQRSTQDVARETMRMLMIALGRIQ